MKLAELFREPQTWVRGMWAMDVDMEECDTLDYGACAWSLEAAIEKCYGLNTDEGDAVFFKVLNALPQKLLSPRERMALVQYWNDKVAKNQAEVQALCERLGV